MVVFKCIECLNYIKLTSQVLKNDRSLFCRVQI